VAEVLKARAGHREGPEREAPGTCCTWRAGGPGTAASYRQRKARIGFDYVHVAADDHSRLAYEVLTDEKGPSCAGVLAGAAAFMAAHAASGG